MLIYQRVVALNMWVCLKIYGIHPKSNGWSLFQRAIDRGTLFRFWYGSTGSASPCVHGNLSWFLVPSGKLTMGKSPCWMGKLTISTGPFSIANCECHYQRLSWFPSSTQWIFIPKINQETSLVTKVGAERKATVTGKQLDITISEYIGIIGIITTIMMAILVSLGIAAWGSAQAIASSKAWVTRNPMVPCHMSVY